jgi:hypothetical protein
MTKKITSITINWGPGCPPDCFHAAQIHLVDVEDKDKPWAVVDLHRSEAEELNKLILEWLASKS